MSALDAAPVLVSAFGVVAGLLVFGATRRLRLALSVLLELLTAAGLLRLSAEGSWAALGGAASIVFVRKLVTRSLA